MTVIPFRPRALRTSAASVVPTTSGGVRADHVFVCDDGPWFCGACGQAATVDNLDAACPAALRRARDAGAA